MAFELFLRCPKCHSANPVDAEVGSKEQLQLMNFSGKLKCPHCGELTHYSAKQLIMKEAGQDSPPQG